MRTASGEARQTASQSFACVPSQNGSFLVCLQAHQAMRLASSITTRSGSKSVPRWDPSQKGCVWDRPQVHHQYSPGSTFWTMGLFCGQRGSVAIDLVFSKGRDKRARGNRRQPVSRSAMTVEKVRTTPSRKPPKRLARGGAQCTTLTSSRELAPRSALSTGCPPLQPNRQNLHASEGGHTHCR